MSQIHAKFYVAEVRKFANGTTRPGYADPAPIGEVTLRAVTRGNEDKSNAQWASATPAGEMKMTVRGEALPSFEALLGRDVAITIEPFEA